MTDSKWILIKVNFNTKNDFAIFKNNDNIIFRVYKNNDKYIALSCVDVIKTVRLDVNTVEKLCSTDSIDEMLNIICSSIEEDYNNQVNNIRKLLF